MPCHRRVDMQRIPARNDAPGSRNGHRGEGLNTVSTGGLRIVLHGDKTPQHGSSMVLRQKHRTARHEYLYTHFSLRTLIGEAAMEFDDVPFMISNARTLRAVQRSITAQPDFLPLKTSFGC